jgi:hypothetical protein
VEENEKNKLLKFLVQLFSFVGAHSFIWLNFILKKRKEKKTLMKWKMGWIIYLDHDKMVNLEDESRGI